MKWTVETVNGRLKAGKIGVTVRQRGDRLSLRATLPPKPNGGKQIWHQQDISLKIYSNPAGLQRAEAEAKLLGARIASGEFSWSLYIDIDDMPQSSSSAEEWVKMFEEDYFARRGRSPTTEQTWKTDYIPYWKLIGEELSQENLIASVKKIDVNTQIRRKACEKLSALAKFAGIVVDLSPYTGNYNYRLDASMRYVPSTQEIESTRLLFSDNPDWQWLYGVLAAYGLRPHEAFFCEILQKPPYLLKVLKGKTGYREVYPYHLRWVEMWQLAEQRKPPCNGSTLRAYGSRATQFFHRRQLKFSPYCLRHAFCIRLATEYKIPVPVAAKWTGHDPAIFLKTYNRWISGDEMRRVFEESQKNSR